MIGRRIYPDAGGHLRFAPGDYGKDVDGMWWVRTPNGHAGTIPQHTVVEHEDGTITVSPSILVTDGQTPYHGFLERGVWREC